MKRLENMNLFGVDNNKDLEMVSKNGMSLEYVEKQTPEICLAAVKQDGRALRYVKDQTPELCLAAVKQDERALQFVNVEYVKSHVI